MCAVDIRVLVNQTVTGIVPDHLNRNIELIFATNTVTQRSHLRTSLNGVRPHKHRDVVSTGFSSVGIRSNGKLYEPSRAPAVAAVNPNVTGKDCQHRNGTSRYFTVSMTLRSPPLTDICRFSATDFTCQFDDSISRNTGNLRCPFRGLGDTVFRPAQEYTPYSDRFSVRRPVRFSRRNPRSIYQGTVDQPCFR